MFEISTGLAAMALAKLAFIGLCVHQLLLIRRSRAEDARQAEPVRVEVRAPRPGEAPRR